MQNGPKHVRGDVGENVAAGQGRATVVGVVPDVNNDLPRVCCL